MAIKWTPIMQRASAAVEGRAVTGGAPVQHPHCSTCILSLPSVSQLCCITWLAVPLTSHQTLSVVVQANSFLRGHCRSEVCQLPWLRTKPCFWSRRRVALLGKVPGLHQPSPPIQEWVTPLPCAESPQRSPVLHTAPLHVSCYIIPLRL